MITITFDPQILIYLYAIIGFFYGIYSAAKYVTDAYNKDLLLVILFVIFWTAITTLFWPVIFIFEREHQKTKKP